MKIDVWISYILTLKRAEVAVDDNAVLYYEQECREIERCKARALQASFEHCQTIKVYYEKTKSSPQAKREQYTSIPMSFWKVLEAMLTDERI